MQHMKTRPPPYPLPPLPSSDTGPEYAREASQPESRCEVLLLLLTPPELRALVSGAGLLGVRTASLLAWAGTVNPSEPILPRWRRPYVTEEALVRYVAALDVGALLVARALAARFGIDVETHLIARTFHWLRRIRAVNLENPRWARLEVPAARVPWRLDEKNGGAAS